MQKVNLDSVMNNEFCVVVSVVDYNSDCIHKCAVKFNDDIPVIGATFMHPENKEFLREKLPLHVKNIGPIVDVEPIFEIEDTTS